MKIKTKKYQLIKFCSECPYFTAVVVTIIGNFRVFNKRCSNPLIDIKYKDINPVSEYELKGENFPTWCPLEDGEEIEI